MTEQRTEAMTLADMAKVVQEAIAELGGDCKVMAQSPHQKLPVIAMYFLKQGNGEANFYRILDNAERRQEATKPMFKDKAAETQRVTAEVRQLLEPFFEAERSAETWRDKPPML